MRRLTEKALVVAIIFAGAIVRYVGWYDGVPRLTEAQRVAVALVTKGQFADAFQIGSGPTAHVSPIMPFVIATVYEVAGVATPLAETILSLLSITFVGLSIWFCWCIFNRLGAARPARVAAVACTSLVPVLFALEVRELKAWEGSLTVAAVTGLLLLALKLDSRDRLRWLAMMPLVVGAALLFMTSPPAALAVLGMIALLMWRRLPRSSWTQVVAATALAFALVVTPWALRNQQAMGRLILVRSNANMEMAVAYNDKILDKPNRRQAYQDRVHEISPTHAGPYAEMVAAGGEVRYNDRLGLATSQWVHSHPQAVAKLVIRHLVQYIVPPGWFYDLFGVETSRFAALWSGYLGLTFLFCVVGMPFVLPNRTAYGYVLMAILVMMLPYVVAQPILRYRYLTTTLSVFGGLDMAWRVAVAWASRRRISAAAS